MNNITLTFSFMNVFNFVFGIVFGFILMIMISCGIFSKIISKYNKSKEIRKISKDAYSNYYKTEIKTNDKIIKSLLFEVTEVSKLVYPDKKHPYFELSINDIMKGLLLIQRKLKKVVSNPLFKDLKNVHICKVLQLEETLAKPVLKIKKNKFVKMCYEIFIVVKSMLNIINPVFYMKLIIKYTLFKKGKKDLILICLDFIGNTTYEIYNNENNLQKENIIL